MTLENLQAIVNAARIEAHKAGEDVANLCVLLNCTVWDSLRGHLASAYLFDLGQGANPHVFFYAGVFVSWSPLIASPRGWAVGRMFA